MVWVKSTKEHYLERKKYRNFVSRHLRSRYCRGGTLALLEQNAALITARGLSNPGYSCCDAEPKPDQAGRLPGPVQIRSQSRQILRLTWWETMGGYDVAFEVIQRALSNGKHVVREQSADCGERHELFAGERQ